ncbi:MAG: AAA-like domain-containing protein [Deltaproteobacteria bacterium]|nr:AAA-like domain-containing protein [Deltaproteobacteria bacterium]
MAAFEKSFRCDLDDQHFETTRFVIPEQWGREILPAVKKGGMFAVEAPPKTGKTVLVRHLVRHLRESGEMIPVFIRVQSQRKKSLDVSVEDFLTMFAASVQTDWPESFRAKSLKIDPENRFDALGDAIFEFYRAADKPMAVFATEADSLSTESATVFFENLMSFVKRLDPKKDKPVSIVISTVKPADEIAILREKPGGSGGSGESGEPGEPEKTGIGELFGGFRVFKLPRLNEAQVTRLAELHYLETNQNFTNDSIERIFHWTRGHPHLLQNLLYHAISVILGRVVEKVVTGEVVDRAVYLLLSDRLTRNVLNPLSSHPREKAEKYDRLIRATLASEPELPEVPGANVLELRDEMVRLGILGPESDGFVSTPLETELLVLDPLAEDIQYPVSLFRTADYCKGDVLNVKDLLRSAMRFWRKLHVLAMHRVTRSGMPSYPLSFVANFIRFNLKEKLNDLGIVCGIGRGHVRLNLNAMGRIHPLRLAAVDSEKPDERLLDEISETAGREKTGPEVHTLLFRKETPRGGSIPVWTKTEKYLERPHPCGVTNHAYFF